MKKIIYILTAATLISCTKSEVTYEPTHEIGFTAVAGNITKAVVDGDEYPTGLNMYINSYVHNTTVPTTPDYINNGEFTQIGTYASVVGDNNATNEEKTLYVWGGGTSTSSRNPYYWPNTKTLHFSGYSKSGNVGAASTPATASYNPSTDQLSITGYTPGTGFATVDGATVTVANDLMWFPSTKHTNANGYDKDTRYVPVNMYHTCSWITFMVKGDMTTGSSTSTYKVTSLTMNGLDMTANVVCTGDNSLSQNNLPTYVVWSENTTKTETYSIAVNNNVVELKNTYNTGSKNIETGSNTNTGGNIVVIPQVPGKLCLTYTYNSSTGAEITEKIEGDKALDLKITTDATDSNNKWEPGKHYIYTITIKANEILIAPTPVDWTDSTVPPITVE